MPQKVLIIGHAGFTGKHLVNYLQTVTNTELIGIDKYTSGNCNEFEADITVFDELNPIITSIQPDYIINLAGLNYAESPVHLYQANLFPVINILRSLQHNNLYNTKLLLISSAAVYGNCRMIPIKEDNPLEPVNFYGTSKLAMEQIVSLYQHQFHINIARPFNIMGPGLPEKMSVPAFINQLKTVKDGKTGNTIKTGNLEPKRDFVDIRDVVKAYWLILTQGISGEIYNVGSGTSIRMADILNLLIKSMQVDVKLYTDSALVRTNEIMDSIADISKISHLGWAPIISLENSLADMVLKS